MRFSSLSLLLFLVSSSIFGQNVGINTDNSNPDPSAMLDIKSTDKGLLIPRVSLISVVNGSSPVPGPTIGLLVYNTNLTVTGGSGTGFYYWTGTLWEKLASGSTSDHDWYEVGTVTPPDNINDNQYTLGNVGIGISTPTHRLDISGGNTSIDKYLILKDFDTGTENVRAVSRDNSFLFWQGGVVVGQYAVGTVPAGFTATGTFLTKGQSALAVSSGSVGIGNTTPEQKLDARGYPIQWANRSILGTDQGGSIELGSNSTNAGIGAPYIDFHFNGLTEDFNTRIQNSANGVLTFFAANRSIFSNGVRMAGIPASAVNTTVITQNATGDLETRAIPANIWDGDDNTTYTAGTGLSLTGTTFSNAAPDQLVTLTGTGATTISGTYPNFTINSTDNNTTYSAGTGINLTGTTFSSTLGTSIESIEITDGTILAADLNQMGATPNQVLTWNGSNWAPAATASDHDWYEVGGSNAPDNIIDNQYTYGKIGVGTNNPVATLHIK